MLEPEPNHIEVIKLDEIILTEGRPKGFKNSIRQLDHINPTNNLYVRIGFNHAGPLDRMFAFGALDGAGASGHRWIVYKVKEAVSVRYLTWILNTPSIFYEIRSEEPDREEMRRIQSEMRQQGDRISDPYVIFTDNKIRSLEVPLITNRSATEQDLITQRFEYQMRNQIGKDDIFYPDVAKQKQKEEDLRKGLGLS